MHPNPRRKEAKRGRRREGSKKGKQGRNKEKRKVRHLKLRCLVSSSAGTHWLLCKFPEAELEWKQLARRGRARENHCKNHYHPLLHRTSKRRPSPMIPCPKGASQGPRGWPHCKESPYLLVTFLPLSVNSVTLPPKNNNPGEDKKGKKWGEPWAQQNSEFTSCCSQVRLNWPGLFCWAQGDLTSQVRLIQ